MNIKILGSGCAYCVNLEKVAKQAASELGIAATAEEIDKATRYGLGLRSHAAAE